MKPSTRGEPAWKETRDGVASRNAETRKAGKVERETYERERATVRHAAAVKRDEQLRSRHKRKQPAAACTAPSRHAGMAQLAARRRPVARPS